MHSDWQRTFQEYWLEITNSTMMSIAHGSIPVKQESKIFLRMGPPFLAGVIMLRSYTSPQHELRRI